MRSCCWATCSQQYSAVQSQSSVLPWSILQQWTNCRLGAALLPTMVATIKQSVANHRQNHQGCRLSFDWSYPTSCVSKCEIQPYNERKSCHLAFPPPSLFVLHPELMQMLQALINSKSERFTKPAKREDTNSGNELGGVPSLWPS